MIYIKDKGNRTQIFIPRNGEVAVDYATEADIVEINEKLTTYATKEYVDALVGDINNRLQEILD